MLLHYELEFRFLVGDYPTADAKRFDAHPLILLCFIPCLIVGVGNGNGVKPRAGPAFPLQGPTAHPAQTTHRVRKPR